MATERRGGWCAFRERNGQWDLDDSCTNGAAFSVGGFGMKRVEVCVRHIGYAIAADLDDADEGVYSVDRLPQSPA